MPVVITKYSNVLFSVGNTHWNFESFTVFSDYRIIFWVKFLFTFTSIDSIRNLELGLKLLPIGLLYKSCEYVLPVAQKWLSFETFVNIKPSIQLINWLLNIMHYMVHYCDKEQLIEQSNKYKNKLTLKQPFDSIKYRW